MPPISPHMQRGFHQLTREVALSMLKLRNASSNIQYAASQIAYSRRKKR